MAEPQPIADWRQELFRDANLWEVYTKYYFLVGGKHDRKIVMMLSAVGLIVTAVATVFVPGGQAVERLAGTARAIAPIGLNVAVGVLGFLIAAFAIFISTMSRTLLVQLAKIPKKGSDLSQFRFILVSYMSIFMDYAFLLVVTAIVAAVGTDGGVSALASVWLDENAFQVLIATNSLAIVATLVLFVQALLQLKSFLWNLYQSLVLYVATLPEEDA